MIESVFIASPLFNASERKFNEEIAGVIEIAGMRAFLPQRDGMLLRDVIKGLERRHCPETSAKEIANKLIFHIDAYNAYWCDATVLNLNGRVADEGALVEGTIAYCSGKPLVVYKSDNRSLICGQDNPLVLGLNDKILDKIEDIVSELERQDKRIESLYDVMLRNGVVVDRGRGDIGKLVEIGLEYFS